MKFKDRPKGIIEGLGVPYGGPVDGKDLYGQAFVKTTNFALDWFKGQRPLLFEHGLDDLVGLDQLGHVRKIDAVEEGLWIEAQLNKRHDYYNAVAQLIADEALGLSSGSAPHLIQVDSSGVIRSWPILEMSLTTSPANPFATVSAFKSFRAVCDDKGIDLESLKSADPPPPVNRDDSDWIWQQKQRLRLLDAN